MKRLLAQIDAAMAAYLEAQREDYLRQPVFATLYNDLVEFVCRPGKRLRPLLFLTAYRIFRESAASRGVPPLVVAEKDLLAVAVSLEFLHGFILIHDDIIDRSETRRSRPTLHRVIESRLPALTNRQRSGRNLALVMGDILFALAQKCLLEARLPADTLSRLGTSLLACMVETGFGEAADIIHSTRDVSKVSLPEIEQMYLLKTTRYTIECPLTMAAVLAGAGAEEVASLARIARPAGLAFQIQNDLQEFARFEVSDVEVPADILEGKKTMLMRTAFSRLNETDQSLLQMCLSANAPSDGTVSKARELVVKSGAVGQLAEMMDRLFAEADRQTRTSAEPFFCADTQDGLMGLIHLVRGAAARC